MEVDWTLVIGDIMTQVLRIVLPLFVALIIKWAVELYHKIKTEQPEWTPVLEYAAEMAVLAAEQIYGAGQGNKKKQYAIDTVSRLFASYGLKIDAYVIADAIEAEVYKWLHHDELPEGGNADGNN